MVIPLSGSQADGSAIRQLCCTVSAPSRTDSVMTPWGFRASMFSAHRPLRRRRPSLAHPVQAAAKCSVPLRRGQVRFETGCSNLSTSRRCAKD